MNINKVLLSAAAVVLSTLAVSQPSAAREFGEIYTQCGLGAMIAPNTEGVAAVTNVTWDLGTTAISSNVSSPDTCQGGKAKKAAFIHDAYEQIAKDLARGNGSYVETLVTLSGCQPAVRSAVVSALRGDFATAVANPAYSAQSRYDRAETLYNLLQDRIEADFGSSCSIG